MEDKGEYQALGDLPYDDLVERGEHRHYRGTPQQRRSPIVKAIDAGVLPTYDALPANGGRFAIGQQVQQAVNSGSFAAAITVFSYRVPAGKVLYARQMQVNVDRMLSGGSELGIPSLPFTVSLYINGQCEVFNQNILIQALDGYYPCSLIGGYNDVVTIVATINTAQYAAGSVDQIDFVSHLTGDMLIVNDMQTQYTALKPTIVNTKQLPG